MCGFAGLAYFDFNREIDQYELKKMADSIRHRGPDDEGFFIDHNIGLAFRRLSIIDIQHGSQPLCNEDGTVWLVFNGEIYNYKQLRNELIHFGHTFASDSDSEVLVHLYEEYGVDCLSHLRGMFAFVIYDKCQKKIFCARDRFGIKPFFYSINKEGLAFGSEIKAIRAAEGFKETNIDITALDTYLAYGYITGNKSIYENIYKLAPASYIIMDIASPKSFKVLKYWEIQFEPDFSKSETQWIEEFNYEFDHTVSMHMMSDVPIGAFLSGGIDSGAVVAAMSKNAGHDINTFSLGFQEKSYNELPYAGEIAKRFNTKHHEMVIGPQSLDILPRIIEAYDEPFADSSAIPTYILSEFTSKYVKVALSGDGGDELFAGYPDYAKMFLINKFNVGNSWFNKQFWGRIHNMVPKTFIGKGLTYHLSKNRELLPAHFCIWNQIERGELFNKKLISQLHAFQSEQFKESILYENKNSDFLSSAQKLDLQTYLVDDILTKVDRASMQNSLEVRVPLLDHVLAELTFRIPSSLKLKYGNHKYILKSAMQGRLPRHILQRPKMGFAVPLQKWFKDDLNYYINDTLLVSNNKMYNYLSKNEVKRLLSDNQTTMRDSSFRIWSLLILSEWLNSNTQVQNSKLSTQKIVI